MPRLSKIGAAALAAFGWTGLQSVTATYLVVAGGGGGGRGNNITSYAGGGGGAGGFRTSTLSLNPTQSYTITVGAGGAGSTSTSNKGTNGTDSVFSSITSTGGGGGGSLGSGDGANGGSGGGAGSPSAAASGGTGNTPATSPSQGNNGGSTSGFVNYGGGGGGATAAGGTGNTVSGAGGAGTASSITGSSVTYAGGGGGGGFNSGGAGGSGGGGTGGISSSVGTAGTANTGGGGGGGPNNNGSSGGSGIVIISYVGAQQFGGGVVTSSGGNTIHTFTTSGTLVPITPLSASYLVVAGGGGGGQYTGSGGGGAGGFRTSSAVLDTNSIYTVTVGAGGAGGVSGSQSANGSDSAFSSTTSTGGGGGGGYTGSFYNGKNGGSGGGGNYSGAATNGTGNTPSTSPSQGNNGGAGGVGNDSGGGGGGATAAGTAGAAAGGNGGAGTASSISGSSVTYAGGGGGAKYPSGTAGTGGAGGGGNGGVNAAGTAGTANTGGGGGGSGSSSTAVAGGSGGSGVVIISYPGSTQQMAGGTVTITGGNVIHTFTSTGYLSPLKYVNNSLRFRSSATAYLNRTNSSSVTNNKIFTYSLWVKRGSFGVTSSLLAGDNSTAIHYFGYGNSSIAADTLEFYDGQTAAWKIQTNAVYRDPSAYYHVILSVDTTQATAANRVRIYVNGVECSYATATYPAQNTVPNINVASMPLYIGRRSNVSQWYLDGYLTEINFIDGQALTPNSFGTFNSYGVWQPITYGGSYGTNGFYLPFTNTTSTTTLGYDFSPNGNNWTTNNISLTAGTTYDSMTDVPTLTSATAANYSVANPLSTLFTVTAGNMDFTYTNSTSGVWYLKGTLAVSSDKYYWEVTPTNVGAGSNISIGIILSSNTQTNTTTINLVTDGYVYHCDGNKYSGAGGATGVAYGATYTNNDVIGVALDLTAGTLVFYKNNVSQGTAFTGLTSSYMQLICNHLGGTSRTVAGSVNAGQRPFTYTPPSGFVALNTFNL